jgi:xylulokinase
MHGATLLDAQDRPLRPAILWNDGRSGLRVLDLERREPNSRAITGNIMMPGFTAPKLLWVSRHEPEIFRRTACVLLPKDYVRLKMTARSSATCRMPPAPAGWMSASAIGPMLLLAATGLTRAHMPRLVEGSPAGTNHGGCGGRVAVTASRGGRGRRR